MYFVLFRTLSCVGSDVPLPRMLRNPPRSLYMIGLFSCLNCGFRKMVTVLIKKGPCEMPDIRGETQISYQGTQRGEKAKDPRVC